MIIFAYFGVGKTTSVYKYNDCNFIELEMNDFKVCEDNPEMSYCRVAKRLSQQGYNVFVYPSIKIIDYVCNCDISIFKESLLIIPSLELKEQWLDKLKDRYVKNSQCRDGEGYYKAYISACSNYDERINFLMNLPVRTHIITDMNYDMINILFSNNIPISRRGCLELYDYNGVSRNR